MKNSQEMQVDVAIIGAGSAGLCACSEVKKVTDNFVLVHDGDYGTTCVRTGCMPFAAFAQAIHLYHQRYLLWERGISGADQLALHLPALLDYVRKVREHFLHTIRVATAHYKPHLIEGFASFIAPTMLQVGTRRIRAKKIIIATGSSPIVPEEWQDFQEFILTSDTLFEQKDLPPVMAVIGLSMLGMEMGQALSRAGVEVSGFDRGETIGKLTDPVVNSYVFDHCNTEMPLWLGHKLELSRMDTKIQVKAGSKSLLVDKLFMALGRAPNLHGMGLEALGIVERGKLTVPCDPHTMQLGNLPIYIAGDVERERPLLHEAQDEGHIAGYNAVHSPALHFKRRTLLMVVHTDPAIVIVGAAWESLPPHSFYVGETRFEEQGTASLMGEPVGILRIYAHKNSSVLLGAEMVAPGGEHLGHLLAWLIEQKRTVFEALSMTFYHPVIEESLRTALQELAAKFPEEAGKHPIELQDYAA